MVRRRAASVTDVLGQRALNRALLARQLLLERSGLPLPRALERIGGIQAQYAPSMYIGLWSRLAEFHRQQLTAALERDTVVQGTLLRATIHLVSRRDYWAFTTAIAEERRKRWLRATHRSEITATEMAALARRARARLAGTTMRRSEIQELTGDAVRTNGVGMWLDLLRVPPSGTWEHRRADLYALAEDRVPRPPIEHGSALDHLVTSYLRGFGPARPAEIADWAGLPPGTVARVLGRLELRSFGAEDGAKLLDLPRAPRPDPETSAPARFLPTWDATLLVHARRSGILPEDLRPRVFGTKTPQSVPTFTLDGVVAGSWRLEHGRIVLVPFRRLARAERAELDDEAERLARLHR
jgi:DNA glycosylase AlkZ-like